MGVALVILGLGLWQTSIGQDKAEKQGDDEGAGLRIIEEKGPAGHSTIGIDESTVSHEGLMELPLTFSELMTWDYSVDNHAPPPHEVKELNGRKVRLVGFMYPLQDGSDIQYFCLMRSTQTCCYGPRPQYNQYVFVEMDKPTAFYRLDPVSCVGNLYVEPTPEEGFIYRMEGQMCAAATKQ
jgi:hypothetical protein